eukprot:scaffold23785_cov30-Prasinocladus_malaysianus.AAC.2
MNCSTAYLCAATTAVCACIRSLACTTTADCAYVAWCKCAILAIFNGHDVLQGGPGLPKAIEDDVHGGSGWRGSAIQSVSDRDKGQC